MQYGIYVYVGSKFLFAKVNLKPTEESKIANNISGNTAYSKDEYRFLAWTITVTVYL
jgi:hypothetical protein